MGNKRTYMAAIVNLYGHLIADIPMITVFWTIFICIWVTFTISLCISQYSHGELIPRAANYIVFDTKGYELNRSETGVLRTTLYLIPRAKTTLSSIRHATDKIIFNPTCDELTRIVIELAYIKK